MDKFGKHHVLINQRGFGPSSEEGKMYNPDWYYTQPPEPSSEEDYEQEIAKAEQRWEMEREAQDD
jgi:hypothetical protein